MTGDRSAPTRWRHAGGAFTPAATLAAWLAGGNGPVLSQSGNRPVVKFNTRGAVHGE